MTTNLPITSLYLIVLAGVASLFYFLLIPAILIGHISSRVHRLFAAYLLFSAIFTAGVFVAYTTSKQEVAEAAYLSITGPYLMSILSYYLFSKSFTKTKISPTEEIVVSVVSLILIAALISLSIQFFSTGSFPNLLGEVKISPLTRIYSLRVSPLSSLFIPLILLILLMSWLTIFRSYQKTNSLLETERHKYLLIGLSFLILSSLKALIPAEIVKDLPSDVATTLINVMLITYTISQHKLFNINTVFSKLILYFNVTVLVTGLYIGVAIFLRQDFIFEGLSLATVIISAAIVTLFFQPLWSSVQRLVNRTFFGHEYEQGEFIIELGKSLAQLTNTKDLALKLEEFLSKALNSKKVRLYTELPITLTSETPLLKSEVKTKKLKEFLSNEGLEVLVPIPFNNKNNAAIGLGAKKSGKKYTLSDINLVAAAVSQLAIALQNAKHYEEVIESLKLKDEFLAIASAHLRTPITAISGYLNYLLGKTGQISNEEKEMIIKHIKANNERLSALIDELLTISGLEQGKVRITPHETSIDNVIDEVVSSLSYLAAENRVTIYISLPPTPLPNLKIDKAKIKEAITNVVNNAIKFNKPNGNVRITAIQTEDNKIKIIVTDTGIGIPENQIPKLFQKFYRLETTKDREGVGLGLYIAKLIIEAHKGQIEIKSKENQGTTVTITLPISQEIPAEIITKR